MMFELQEKEKEVSEHKQELEGQVCTSVQHNRFVLSRNHL